MRRRTRSRRRSSPSSAMISRAGAGSQTRWFCAVLGAGPAQRRHRLARHLPPAVDDVLAPHVATSPGRWPVSRISLQRATRTRPASSNAVQNLGTSQSARTRSRLLVALRSTPRHGLAVTSSSFDRPAEDRRRRGQHLVGQHGRLDPGHHRADVGAGDARRLQLAPSRQQVAPHQGVGLPPGLVLLLGVLLDVRGPARRRCRRRARPASRRPGPYPWRPPASSRRPAVRASASPMAPTSPRCNQRGRPWGL